MNPHPIRTAAREGALAWAAYAVVETAFVVWARWLGIDRLDYLPVHPAFNLLVLVVYPLAGAAAGALIAALTAARLVRTAGLLALPLAFIPCALVGRDFQSWTAAFAALAAVLAVLIAAAELRPSWAGGLGWAANPWWVAGVLAGATVTQREIAIGLSRAPRFAWTLGLPAGITLVAVLWARRFPRPASAARRAAVTAAVAVAMLLTTLIPRQPVPELAPSAAAAGSRPNVLLITLDTVRADHLPLYGYARNTTPNLQRFASEAVLYRRPVAPSEMTLPSHASIFTGLYPTRHGAHFSPQYLWGHPLETPSPTLAEYLRGRGYYTAAIAANAGYLRHRFALDRGFLHWDNRWAVEFLSDLPGAWLRELTVRSIRRLVPRQHYGHGYRQAEGSQIPPRAFSKTPAPEAARFSCS
jgi:hypothetical protein